MNTQRWEGLKFLLTFFKRTAHAMNGAIGVPYVVIHALHGTQGAKSVRCRVRKRQVSMPLHECTALGGVPVWHFAHFFQAHLA